MIIFGIDTLQQFIDPILATTKANSVVIISVLSLMIAIGFVCIWFVQSSKFDNYLFKREEERRYGKGGFRD